MTVHQIELTDEEHTATVEALRYYLTRWPNEDSRPAMKAAFHKLTKVPFTEES